ncbi:YadA-like family protein [Escherichia marmotae]|nr:YadA-like family protein [Escherichia marmotae]
MNKIFKVIWNPATGSYSVASETAKSCGKKSGRSKLLISALVVGGLLSSGVYASGLDGGKSAEEVAGDTPLTDGWIAIGKGAVATAGPRGSGTSSVAIGEDAYSALGSTALGYKSNSSGDRALALGQLSKASGSRAIAIGGTAEASGDFTIALGNLSKASGANATAVGKDSEASGSYSLAIGQASEATKVGSVAMGYNSQSNGTGAVALGQDSFVSGNNSVALGNGARTSGNNSIALGAGSLAAADNVISVGNNTDQRKIVFVDKGIINKTSTDAVNGSQIFALSQSVANRLGGNASVNPADGTVNAPTYTISSGTYNNVGDALDAVNSTINTTNTAVTDLKDDSLLWDGTAFSAKHGTSTTNKITNVMAGSLSDTSTDAVNGAQLKTTNDNVTTNTTNITNLTNDVADINTTITGLEDDALQWNGTAFSAKHGTNTTSKITNVMAGSLSDTSTDAVNGAQLKTTNDNIATNTTNLTDDVADINTTITGLEDDALQWNGTAFSAKHGTSTTNKITNVMAGDLSDTSTDAVNGSQLKTTNDNVATNTTNITNLTNDVADINTTITGLEDDALQWNGTAFSAKHGTNTTSKITNVMAGDLSDTSTDAVNGSQLKTTNDNVATNTTNITNLTNDVADINTTITGLEDDSLQWNGTAFSAKHGTSTTNKITNVMAGDLSDTSTDAVNGAQLKTTNDNVATNTTNLTNDVADINTTITGLEDDSLQWNGTAFSAKHGTSTTNKITNVMAGDLSDTSTDAVNGSQLKTTNDNVATNTTNITNLTNDVADINTTITGLEDDSLQWNGTAFSAKHGTSTTNKITNVMAGDLSDTSTDAVNGSQLKTTNDNVTTNTTNITNLTDDVADINTTITGLEDDALQWNGTAFSAKHGTSTTNKITNVAIGDINANSTDAINGSQLYSLSSSVATYLGGNAAVDASGALTGPTYNIDGTDYSNVGDALNAINTSMGNSLGDALLWDSQTGAFSASHSGSASQITNVAAGAVDATSSDAVNGSQLYTMSNSVADALGGGSTVNTDGSISAPSYTIANADYDNVGDALDAIDSTLDDALLWDATAGNNGAFNASHNGSASVITNVADGLVDANSNDAVNGSQLYATNMMINNFAGDTSNTYTEKNGTGINYIRTNDTGLTFHDASATGIGSTAVGYNSVASGASSIAIGQDSSSTIDTGIAIGSNSVSDRVIVKSSRSTSVTKNGVVIGYDTTDGELLGALSIGDDGKYRQIINIADGSEAHDAVTVRQLQNAIGAVATTPTKYFHANSTAEDSLAVGTDSLAIGAKTAVNADAGIGIGLNTLVLTDAINGIAIGSNARVNHADSIAIGNGSQTTRGAQSNYTAYNMNAPQNSVGEFSVGSGQGQRQITNVAAGSADTDAVNVGQLKVTDARVEQNTQSITNLNTQVTNLDTRVTNIENGIGDIVTTGSTKYFKANTTGADANAQGTDSVAIGSGSIAAADNSVALGTGSMADEENTISVGSSTNQRRITNVAAGKNATDAVNVAQLKSSEAGSVRYDTKSDGSVDYSSITLGGGNGGTTRISNVSAGVENNDAVNYAQLKQSVQETKQYTDQRMVEMDHKLSKTESKLSGGIASAMAMTGLPQAYTPGASMASIGGGTYNGESAVALGVSMVSANGRWVYKLQGSTNSQGEYSAALGAGIQW